MVEVWPSGKVLHNSFSMHIAGIRNRRHEERAKGFYLKDGEVELNSSRGFGGVLLIAGVIIT